MWNKIKTCIMNLKQCLCSSIKDIQLEELKKQYQMQLNENIHLHRKLEECEIAMQAAKDTVTERSDKLKKTATDEIRKKTVLPKKNNQKPKR